MVKNSPAKQETQLLSPGREDSLEKEMAIFHVVRESKLSLKREVEITILRNEAEIKKKNQTI